ncbi:hypothetical protein QFC22_001766 [Naganishia vaughanmartiniae]|uniref:Uncharacterized protein n=1 Tax=Naganishia vaughanmartiniae TaxID=1424756 RepID=A0ACC2XFG2_9TREE|nr:hypothetical protein QFC22_001766 [Naganishia vaughanmartiniae]
MDYDNPYAGAPAFVPGGGAGASYQTDTSIMRPANLPPLSYQTLGAPGGAGSPGGYRGAGDSGFSYGHDGGPDRHAPRRGGYRGDRPAYSGRGGRGRGRGGGGYMSSGREREYDDRSSYNSHTGGAGGSYEGDRAGGQGSYQGGAYGSNPAPRDGYGSYPPPARNEYDDEKHQLSSRGLKTPAVRLDGSDY